MQYQVPQFIEIEDKIIGPLTLKQFIYLAGGGGLSLLFFTLLPIYLAAPLIAAAVAAALSLAFYKINDRPFIVAIEHAFSYQLGSKLYLWKQRDAKVQTAVVTPQVAAAANLSVPKLSQSRLKDLSWSLNIKDRAKIEGGAIPPSGLQI
jgi:hypothetical protein